MKKFLMVMVAMVIVSFSSSVAFAAVDYSALTFVSLPDWLEPYLQEDGVLILPVPYSDTEKLSAFFDLYNDTDNYYRMFSFFTNGPDNPVLYISVLPRLANNVGSYTDTYGVNAGFIETTSYKPGTFFKSSSFSFSYDSSTNLFSNKSFSLQSDFSMIKFRNSISYLKPTTTNILLDEELYSIICEKSPNTSILKYCNFITGITDVYIEGYQPKTKSTITVNYLYSENNPAADSVTQTLAAGEEYSIPSPEIAGYTPSIRVVTGTMPDEDLTVNVYYSKSFYLLTVKYQYPDGSQAAEDVVLQYPSGFVYDVPSPAIAGYRPDKQTVTGTMPGSAREEVVTYTPMQYDLTIYYRYADGSQAAGTHQEQLQAGASYSVTSPAITGYQPDQTVISGSMPAKDTSFTVIYTPDSGGGGVDPGGDGEDPGGGGEDPGGSGSGGDDPFDIPSQPPFSGYDPFIIPGLPSWSGYDPFRIRSLPPYSYNPFVIPQQ